MYVKKDDKGALRDADQKFANALNQNSHNGAFIGMRGDFS